MTTASYLSAADALAGWLKSWEEKLMAHTFD